MATMTIARNGPSVVRTGDLNHSGSQEKSCVGSDGVQRTTEWTGMHQVEVTEVEVVQRSYCRRKPRERERVIAQWETQDEAGERSLLSHL